MKAKILFGYSFVSENRYQYNSFLKAKWYKVNFQKVGDTCILVPSTTLYTQSLVKKSKYLIK